MSLITEVTLLDGTSLSTEVALQTSAEVVVTEVGIQIQGPRGYGVFEEWAARPENAGKTYNDFIQELSLAPPLTENQW